MRKNIVTVAILIIAIAAISINFFKSQTDGKDVAEENATIADAPVGIYEGNLAPDFQLATLDGEAVKLSDYRGKKVILNFWATWCPPCKAEMPHMENFYKKNKENGIEILAVNLTSQDNGIDAIQAFVKDYGLTFPILLDEKGDVGLEQYKAETIPTTYILNSQGIITKKVMGPMNEEMLADVTKNIQ